MNTQAYAKLYFRLITNTKTGLIVSNFNISNTNNIYNIYDNIAIIK